MSLPTSYSSVSATGALGPAAVKLARLSSLMKDMAMSLSSHTFLGHVATIEYDEKSGITFFDSTNHEEVTDFKVGYQVANPIKFINVKPPTKNIHNDIVMHEASGPVLMHLKGVVEELMKGEFKMDPS
jgi:hypothetical protein